MSPPQDDERAWGGDEMRITLPDGDASTKCSDGRGDVVSEYGTIVTGKIGPYSGLSGTEKHRRPVGDGRGKTTVRREG